MQKKKLKEKETNCEKLEAEVVSLGKDLENEISQLSQNLKFVEGNETLTNIINY